jgi:hypothetical protein
MDNFGNSWASGEHLSHSTEFAKNPGAISWILISRLPLGKPERPVPTASVHEKTNSLLPNLTTLASGSNRILTDDPVGRNFTQHESIVESGHTETVAPLMRTSLVLSR